MTDKYENGDCRITHSDYLDFLNGLDEGSVDLILTDPPYNISKPGKVSMKGTYSARKTGIALDFGEWDHDAIDLEAMAVEMYRVLRDGGTAIVWYDLWKTSYLGDALGDAGFKMLRQIIWQKSNPVPTNNQRGYLSTGREFAVLGIKGSCSTFNASYDTGLYHMPIPNYLNGDKLHPTQKPLDLFAELVLKHSNAGDLVVDCFLGSGTTAEAAINCDRKFLGCDSDPEYYALSCRRLDNILRQTSFDW